MGCRRQHVSERIVSVGEGQLLGADDIFLLAFMSYSGFGGGDLTPPRWRVPRTLSQILHGVVHIRTLDPRAIAFQFG